MRADSRAAVRWFVQHGGWPFASSINKPSRKSIKCFEELKSMGLQTFSTTKTGEHMIKLAGKAHQSKFRPHRETSDVPAWNGLIRPKRNRPDCVRTLRTCWTRTPYGTFVAAFRKTLWNSTLYWRLSSALQPEKSIVTSRSSLLKRRQFEASLVRTKKIANVWEL